MHRPGAFPDWIAPRTTMPIKRPRTTITTLSNQPPCASPPNHWLQAERQTLPASVSQRDPDLFESPAVRVTAEPLLQAEETDVPASNSRRDPELDEPPAVRAIREPLLDACRDLAPSSRSSSRGETMNRTTSRRSSPPRLSRKNSARAFRPPFRPIATRWRRFPSCTHLPRIFMLPSRRNGGMGNSARRPSMRSCGRSSKSSGPSFNGCFRRAF